MRFSIALMVKKVAPPFAFQCVPSHDAIGIDVSKDDILQNFLGRDDVAMNGGEGCQIGRPRASRTSGTSSGRPVRCSVRGIKLHLLGAPVKDSDR